MSWILKLIGGRVGLVLIAALVGTGIWGWSQARAADAERTRADELVAHKALLTERLGSVARTANENAAQLEQALAESARRETALAEARRSEDAIRAEYDQRLSELQEATRVASPEYQACMRVPVPGGVLRALRVRDDGGGAAAGGRDEDGDAVPEPAEGAAAPL